MLHRKPWKDTEGTVTLNSPLRFKQYEAMDKPEVQEQKVEGEDVGTSGNSLYCDETANPASPQWS